MEFPDKPVLLYDGKCNFCIAVVNFVLKKDHNEQFVFSPLQSKSARALLRKHDENFVNMKTVYLVHDGKIFKRSKAIFNVFSLLGMPWKTVSWFRMLPLVVTDGGYKIIAKHRYKIFGKQEEVIEPLPEFKHRFIF